MRKLLNVALGVLEALGLTVAIWFIGWLLYGNVELWYIFNASDYRNILVAVMALSFFLLCEVTRRSLRAPTSQHIRQDSDKILQPNSPKELDLAEHPIIKKMADSIEDINKNLKHLKAFEPIEQKRQQPTEDK